MATILVVEDEEAYRDPLTYSLEREGFDVIAVADGKKALKAFKGNHIDFVLLDLMLPGMSGTDICRKIRATSQVPIIMVTAKDDVVDVIVGLELGADDYVTKPYRFRELLARINAVSRRSAVAVDEENLRLGEIEMNVDRHELRVRGQTVQLPLREFELLEYLLRNVDRVVTRTQIMERVWGADWFGDPKTLDVHVQRLRTRIEEEPTSPRILITVRGVGYRLVAH